MTQHPNSDRAEEAASRALIDYFYDGVRHGLLPKAEWTHTAHLLVACALLEDLGLVEAERQMPDLIRRYNETIEVANTDSQGYHHTVTIFYLRTLALFLSGAAVAPLCDKVNALLASPQAERDWPLKFYSKELLFSVAARRDWVEPDLTSWQEET